MSLGLSHFHFTNTEQQMWAAPWGLNSISHKNRYLGFRARLRQGREPGPWRQTHSRILWYLYVLCVCNVRPSLKEVGSGWRSFFQGFLKGKKGKNCPKSSPLRKDSRRRRHSFIWSDCYCNIHCWFSTLLL